MIQHFEIRTPFFTAQVHIPINRQKHVNVEFGNCNTWYYPFAFKKAGRPSMTKPLYNFDRRLEDLNAKKVGKRFSRNDLARLVADVIGTVPLCCVRAAKSGSFCAGALEQDEGMALKRCCCFRCMYEFKETIGSCRVQPAWTMGCERCAKNKWKHHRLPFVY